MTIHQTYLELKKHVLNQSEIYEILEYLTGHKYDWLICHQDKLIENMSKYESVIEALKQSVPVAYIVNNKRFYGIDFFVDHRVLIPRIETELVVEQALKWLNNQNNKVIIDLCTGSGNIGITLNHLTNNSTYLLDLSHQALEVCKINLAKTQVTNIQILQGDFLEPLLVNQIKGDLIVCNPPYIDFQDVNVGFSTKYEPQNALFADENGLKFYKEMFLNFPKIIKDLNNFCLIMEFGFEQKVAIEKLYIEFVTDKNFKHKFLKDNSNNWRCIMITNI
ncbi:peptide chain release factor N(5)-glutamine methyltransferase [Williamsoniiplasma luminosum]|uniref:peptide chain release factor N(5)-glutamine methyltransferase n=1 Tax=Williamsoniiplasma luminosum TaxID=214888 RepID=A0A2S0NKV2_9MOLU|nr:peptide chain release factor N(5)-glutamine methyltransferase [Williamsoniiplasma luminosum]AVP49639.1 MAG: peptide chain release factor N(5)-glutamine methyltransferase [Williamsoniiplasma luminosum]